MAQITTILVCLDYHDVRWELPIEVAAGLCRCLVAWQANPPPVDGGVPEGVVKVLASSLVSRALDTFPTRTRNLGISFVHASHAEDMQQAFDAEYFVWSQRGQVIFLSPAQAPPPTLSDKRLHLATNGNSLHKLADMGVTGVALPGVDGDVAGIYTFTGQLLKELLTGLRAACDRIGAQFREVTEAELSEALASE